MTDNEVQRGTTKPTATKPTTATEVVTTETSKIESKDDKAGQAESTTAGARVTRGPEAGRKVRRRWWVIGGTAVGLAALVVGGFSVLANRSREPIGDTAADRIARAAVKREQAGRLSQATKGMRIQASASHDYCQEGVPAPMLSDTEGEDYSVQCQSVRGVLVTFDDTSASVLAMHQRLATMGCVSGSEADLTTAMASKERNGSIPIAAAEQALFNTDKAEYQCVAERFKGRWTGPLANSATRVMNADITQTHVPTGTDVREEPVEAGNASNGHNKTIHEKILITAAQIEQAAEAAKAAGKPAPVLVVINRVYVYR